MSRAPRVAAGAPVAIRTVSGVAGAVLVVVPGHVAWFPALVTAAGTAAAIVAPRTLGSLFATAGFVLGWLTASDWAVSLPIGRTVVAAAALYVLQVSTALAAAAPLGARVEQAAVVAWLRRCAWPAVAAAALIALDEALPQQSGTPWIEFGGLLAVLALAVAAGYAVRRRSAPLARLERLR
jgi:hypothetical protein